MSEGAEEGSVWNLIARRAAERPEAVALEWGSERLSYGELARRAARLGAHLAALGVGPEAIVGLCCERSVDLVVGLLGIWQAGGAYLPLDPTYPAERLAFMVEDSGTRVILTQSSLAGRLPKGALAVRLDADLPAIPTPPATPALAAIPATAAYIIYTSGSTGVPKGVVVEHRALASFVAGAVAQGELTAADRLLQFASVSFDASADEIFPCLASGGTLVLRQEGMTGSFAGFLREVERLAITVLSLPTAYWHGLAAELASGPPLSALPALSAAVRLVLFGGEEAQAASLALWRQGVGRAVRLLNSYGPTEATVVTTRCDLATWEGPPGAALPIGVAVPGARTYLVDEVLQALPPESAAEGELWIGGEGLARGYLGRPELTAERFRLTHSARATAGRGSGSTARATWRAGWRTATWSSAAGWTARSRSAVSASSWARSRPPSPGSPGSARRRW